MSATDYSWIQTELAGLYGASVIRELSEIIELYRWYDGPAQDWTTASGLAYKPSKIKTNLIKKLIKEESRFMAGRAPEIRIVPDDSKHTKGAEELEDWLADVFRMTRWESKLIKGVRDCFIGKRVAIKLSGAPGKPLGISFHPSLEFVYEVADDNPDALQKIIFFYQIASEELERSKQRVWRQKYWMEGGKCLLHEALYDGYGQLIRTEHESEDTKLSFIPAYVVINDGLNGDLSGESDVAELIDNQGQYNRLRSDDGDALKFNMFPMRVFTDASQDSMDDIKIAPSATVDLSTDQAAAEGKQAKAEILESHFAYGEQLEKTLSRIRNDMHDLIGVPNVSMEQLKGAMASGQSMRALYWSLICRCEEKWAEWDDALMWVVERLMAMARLYGAVKLPEIDYAIKIEHLYPIPEDEEDEREADLAEVGQQARSRKSYITKWQPEADADGELVQIAKEKRLLQDAFEGAVRGELAGGELSG